MINKVLKTRIIEKQPTDRENFLWNMIGSGIYSASSMLLSLIVIKIIGADSGGVFSIALTISQMLVYIAYFEMRTYLVTDANDEFKFEEYHTTKILLCILMLGISILYTVIKGYGNEKAVIVILVCYSRFLDGYADVYEAQFQKIGRLDIAGKSLAYRTSVYFVVLVGMLICSKDIIISLIVANIFGMIGVWICNIKIMHMIETIHLSFDMAKVKKIVGKCFPLFIGVFCWTYILSASRMAIDGNMNSNYQSYYQIIFMPVSVINLFAGFVLRPLLPQMAEDYAKKELKKFKNVIFKILTGITGITVVCMAGAWLLGIPVLSILSGCDLKEYKGVLVFLLFAGGINSVSFTLYYVLTVMRKMRSILIGYAGAALFAFVISSPLVRLNGINGAAFSFFATVVLLCILFCISIFSEVIRMKNR